LLQCEILKLSRIFFRKQGKSQHNDGNFVVEPTRILLLPCVLLYTAKDSNSFHEKPGVPFIVKPKNRIYAIFHSYPANKAPPLFPSASFAPFVSDRRGVLCVCVR